MFTDPPKLIGPTMAADYYTQVRSEIEPLLPAAAGRVLEVGCAAGRTLKWLKDDHGATFTCGLELNVDVLEELRGNVDVAISSPAETLDQVSAHGPFDVILFLDVLEHLVDPWGVLSSYTQLLAPGGCVIVSVPNIGHLNVLRRLAVGRFDYRQDGILDRTHLRFFVESTAFQLIRSAGLDPVAVLNVLGPDRALAKILNAATLGRLKNYLAVQFIIKGMKGAPLPPASHTVWRESGGY